MRQIEKDMIRAMRNRKDWRCKNTEVACTDETVNVYLHGNRIARYWLASNTLDMTMHGWPTVTTRSRLNAICDAFGGDRFYQADHVQHYGDDEIGAHEVITVRL